MHSRQLILLGAAHVHLPDHLRQIKRRGWTVTHVHDRQTNRRERLCGELKASPVVDLTQLGTLGCSGAIVCSETACHEEDICAALDAGLDVFTEKPMAGSVDAAYRCAERAKRTGRLLHTNYFFRTNPALQALRATIRDGALGQILEARMRFSHDGGYADWLDLDCWMTDPGLACYDGFVDEAVHVLDALQWMIGPIECGHAVTAIALGWPLDDHGAAVVSFRSGASGVVEAGWTDMQMRLELDIVGEDGGAHLSDGKLRAITREDETPVLTETLSPLDSGDGILPFLETLEGRRSDALVPPEEAVAVNALLDAMGLNRG